MRPVLACTVRGCRLPLTRQPHAYTCAAGHTFDVARRGYVNLLQPQDRRSAHAGDSTDAVAARAALLDSGVGRGIVEAMVATVVALDGPERAALTVDLGSGPGDLLATLGTARPIDAIGIDLSTAAAGHAARRFPAMTWVVANADRRLPLLDGSVDLVLSLHARRNAAECARVLARGGRLVVAVPAADDLVELRAAVLGRGVERPRSVTLVAEHEPWFDLVGRVSAREQHRLEPERLRQLLRVTYRGERRSAAARVGGIGCLAVTLASEICVFAAR